MTLIERISGVFGHNPIVPVLESQSVYRWLGAAHVLITQKTFSPLVEKHELGHNDTNHSVEGKFLLVFW